MLNNPLELAFDLFIVIWFSHHIEVLLQCITLVSHSDDTRLDQLKPT